jgi:hypothetical protein
LKQKLEGKGHRVDGDFELLVPGQEWRKALQESFLASDYLLVVLTANTIAPNTSTISSQWVAADVGAARASGKVVLPLCIGNIPFPDLLEDIYTITIPDANALDEAVRNLDDAIHKNDEIYKANTALGLPPGYEHLASAVKSLREDYPYEESVFLMMKFPDQAAMSDPQFRLLSDISDLVNGTLSAYGLKARRADRREFTDDLWNNVCVYMLGCKYGIAILEDRVAAELNPNVALEYGFMKAMNRRVGLFRNSDFRQNRADFSGKLAKTFEIGSDSTLNKASLKTAIEAWLLDLGVPPRERS